MLVFHGSPSLFFCPLTYLWLQRLCSGSRNQGNTDSSFDIFQLVLFVLFYCNTINRTSCTIYSYVLNIGMLCTEPPILKQNQNTEKIQIKTQQACHVESHKQRRGNCESVQHVRIMLCTSPRSVLSGVDFTSLELHPNRSAK